jgi:DNA modification methylase
MCPLTPYYQDSAVTIYHGDCREILPTLEPVDMVITDPPYGTEDLGGGYGRRQNHTPDGRMGRTIAGDKDLETMRSAFALLKLNPEAHVCTFVAPQRMLEAAAICTALGWNYAGECIWDKCTPGLGYTLRYSHESCLIFRLGERLKPETAALSVVRQAVSHVDTQNRHPHEKPVVFWTNILRLCDGVVLDPFMGSGNSLRAAKDLGRKAIGIELSEKYAEMAARRMGQEVLAL